MTALIAALFLVGPLAVVPLGIRLVPPLGDARADRLLGWMGRLAVPAGLALALAFLRPAGPGTAVFAVPWVLVAGLGATAAGVAALGAVREGRLLRPVPERAVWAALAFLLVAATNALADRAGLRPFGFSSTIVLLTAVHFTFAGFVLTLAGVLAHAARPSRASAVALAVLIAGIPVTAVGFFGVAPAAWLGAMLVVGGGIGIGLATIRVAGTIRTRAARVLLRIAGLSLLASMPLAAVYATGVWLGAPWLDLPTMARTHGALNVLGFAIPAMVAWSIHRRIVPPPTEQQVQGKDRRWLTGLLTGLVVGAGSLLAGPIAGAFGILALLAAAATPPREAAVGAALLGFGSAWLAIFLSADARCGLDCVGPDLTPWLLVAGAALAIGAVLTAAAARAR